MLVLRNVLYCQSRFLSKSVTVANRFPRLISRNRLYKQELKDVQNKLKQNIEKGNTVPNYTDAISLRPPKDLLKALGFTCLVGGGAFTLAVISDIERMKAQAKEAAYDFFKSTMTSFSSFYNGEYQEQSFHRQNITDGQKHFAILIGLNLLVFCLWKMKRFEPSMWRYFTNSFASKSLCSPMILSAFSHSNIIHLGLNMYVLYSITVLTIDKFVGPDQFWAFYITAALVSSFTSLAHKAAIRSPIRALGASGAILAILSYVCMKVPDAKLSLIFLPSYTVSAENAILGILLFDLAGLLFRFRLFDHAAHLGGTLFGIFYAHYGERLIWEKYGKLVERFYRSPIN